MWSFHSIAKVKHNTEEIALIKLNLKVYSFNLFQLSLNFNSSNVFNPQSNSVSRFQVYLFAAHKKTKNKKLSAERKLVCCQEAG